MAITDAQRQQVKAFRAEGKTIQAIAEGLGLSPAAVVRANARAAGRIWKRKPKKGHAKRAAKGPKQRGHRHGQARHPKGEMSHADYIRKLPRSMSPTDVIAAGKKVGRKFSSALVTYARTARPSKKLSKVRGDRRVSRGRPPLKPGEVNGTNAKFILAQNPLISSDEVVRLAREAGINIRNRAYVAQVRRGAGIYHRGPNKVTLDQSVALANKALTNGHAARGNVDHLIRTLASHVLASLKDTKVLKLSVDLRTRKYNAFYEQSEEGEI